MSTPSTAARRVVVNEHLFNQIQSIQLAENFGEGTKGFGNCVNWLLQQHLKERLSCGDAAAPQPVSSPPANANDLDAILENLE